MCFVDPFRFLFNGQNINKSRYLEDLIDGLIDVLDDHLALLVHHLLCGEKNAKSCGRQILKGSKIQHQLFDAGNVLLEFRFQLGGGSGVQSAGDGNSQFGSVQSLFDGHNGFLRLCLFKVFDQLDHDALSLNGNGYVICDIGNNGFFDLIPRLLAVSLLGLILIERPRSV